MILQNISDFYNVYDYLYILNGIILTDIIGIILLLSGVLKTKTLYNWYSKYQLNAVIADVLVIFLVIILARYIYTLFFTKYNIIFFILLVLILQIIHDFIFYYITTLTPKGKYKIIDFFKEYANENKIRAIYADSIMMVSSVVFASYLKKYSINTNIIIMIFMIYLYPYLLNW